MASNPPWALRSGSPDGGAGHARLDFDDVVAIDREAVRLCRFHQRGRLRVGQALVALDRLGGHQELGFSTLSAYAKERCSKSGRWAGQVRTMAKRLERLPCLRTMLLEGKLPWSKVELLARHATPATDPAMVALGQEKTVRKLRELFGTTKAANGEDQEADGKKADGSRSDAAAGSDAAGSDAADSADAAGFIDAAAAKCARTGAPDSNRAVEASASEAAPFVDLAAYFDPDRAADPDAPSDADEPVRTLTIRLPVEEAWAFEATRMLVEYLEGAARQGGWLEPLLIEAQDVLRDRTGDTLMSPQLEQRFRNLPELRRKLQQARDEAEQKTEQWLEPHWDASLVEEWPLGRSPFEEDDAPPVHADLKALDRYIQQTCQELASRDFWLGRVLGLLWSARGWLDLGYASATQYARERLGISGASVKTRIALARRAAPLREVANALRAGHLGFEAASLIARVATPETAKAWLERAQERTYKHLQEDVQAAQLLRRLSPEPEPPFPPDEAIRQEMEALERAVLSGELWRVAAQRSEAARAEGQMSAREREGRPDDADGPMFARGPSGDPVHEGNAGTFAPDGQMSACSVGADTTLAHDDRGHETARSSSTAAPDVSRKSAEATVTLRLVVPEELALWYRQLEAAFRRSGLPGSFVMFLCTNFASIWADTLGTSDQWELIYRRDRYRCSSPVCFRRDCTLHHIRYRSRGGGDDPENLTSPCAFCHLEGEHGGRLKILPPGYSPTWILGKTPILVVEGRDKRAVA